MNRVKELCRPARKYKVTENINVVMKATGVSISVNASVSAKGWYMAALKCLSTIGRCEKRAGISVDVAKVAQTRELRRDHQGVEYVSFGECLQHKNVTA